MKLRVKVIASRIYIRKGPAPTFDRIDTLNKGETIIVVNKDGGWYKTASGGYIFADAKYVTTVENLEPAKKPAKTNTAAGKTTSSTANKKAPTASQVKKSASGGIVFKDKKGNTGLTYEEQSYEPSKYTKASQLTTSTKQVIPWDQNFIEENMDIIRRNLGTKVDVGYHDIIHELFVKYNRFKSPHPDAYGGKMFFHVFFTRPDINIYAGGEEDQVLGQSGTISEAKLNSLMANDPVFYFMQQDNRRVLLNLTRHYSRGHDFNMYLSNMSESFELQDEFIDTIDTGETLTGHKISYGGTNIKSNTANSFSINYQDDSQLSVYKMHKAWTNYISHVNRNLARPKREYIKKNILDYACSVYYIITAADGETILFWSKYFGVFPTNTSSNSLSWNKGAPVRIPEMNISYKYSMKEDFNPLALQELNFNSTLDFKYVPSYEKDLLSAGKAFVGPPFVETISDKVGNYSYKLRFRKDSYEGR